MTVIEASSAGVKDLADGSLRITMEFEPRHAAQAYALFGSRGTAVAIAALVPGHAAIIEPEKPKGGSLARLAGQWCKNVQFQNWIRPIYDRHMGGDGSGAGDIDMDEMSIEAFARHAILVFCEVDSRAELDHSEKGAELFQALIRGPFMQHQKNTPN